MFVCRNCCSSFLREFNDDVRTVSRQLDRFLSAEVGVDAAVDEDADVVRCASPSKDDDEEKETSQKK